MLSNGTSKRFEESLLNVRLSTGVSISSTLNGSTAVPVFTVVPWSGIALIVGEAPPFGGVVVIARLQPSARLPSSPGPSSRTYRDHVPFGACPLNTDNCALYG